MIEIRPRDHQALPGELANMGFFKIAAWPGPESVSTTPDLRSLSMLLSAEVYHHGPDALVRCRANTPLSIERFRPDGRLAERCSLSNIEISPLYLGELDKPIGSARRCGEFLSASAIERAYRDYVVALAARTGVGDINEFRAVVELFSIDAIAELGDEESIAPLRALPAEQGPAELQILEETARQLMLRTGAALGALACAPPPPAYRDTPIRVVLDADLCDISLRARQAASERIETHYRNLGHESEILFLTR